MPDAKEVLTGLLSKAYSLDETGVTSLYKEDGSLADDALDKILNIDAERVKSLKGDVEKIGKERYSRGLRETADAFEKDIKEVFGIKDTDKKGKELIAQAKEILAKNAGSIQEEQIKKHPLFLSLEQRLKTDLEIKDKEWETRLNSKISEYEKERTLSKVVDAANVILDNLKPVLPSDANKAKNLRKVFDNEIRNLNYEVKEVEGGKIRYLLLDKDGKRVEDAHGNPVPFENKVKEIAESYFDLQKADERGSGGDPNKKGDDNNGGASSKYVVRKPANRDEYAAMLAEIDDLKIPDKESLELKKKIKDLFEGK